jgi:putative methanogen marker protein 4
MSHTIIGIGIGDNAAKVIESVKKAGLQSAVMVYCRPGSVAGQPSLFSLSESDSPGDRMVRDLMEGRIHAAVRGTLPANETLKALKQQAGVDHLERAALLETAFGKKFFLAPVGVDEGWTIADKIGLVAKVRDIAVRFGLGDRIGVLSGGRMGDIGRHPVVDQSLADAELVSRITGAVHYEICIEDAIGTCGGIIAPEGISGNLIFRTLTFLGSGHGHGAPVLNIDRIFVDTSRASPDYVNALMLAESLLK